MKRNRGFTLTEVMVVMTIMAILTAVAVPSFRAITTANRISSEVQALLGDLQYARSEAVREGLPVVLCAVTDPAPTPVACASSPNWQTGWVIFSDVNGTGTFSTGDVVLRQQQAFTGGKSSDTLLATPTVNAISFNRIGFTGMAAAEVFAFHDVLNRSSATRCISVSAIGTIALTALGTGGCT